MRRVGNKGVEIRRLGVGLLFLGCDLSGGTYFLRKRGSEEFFHVFVKTDLNFVR